MTSPPATDRPLNVPAAAAVHAYTAVGAVLAFWMVVAAYDGRTTTVLWLFLVAMVIDGSDGLLARRLRVKEAIPGFDGALLDNIVDYLTYCFAPILLLWADGRLPGGTAGAVLACLPILASTYGFCRADAKTDDHFFLGFPSYWNILAFYVIVLELSPTVTGVLVAVFSVLVFVPVKYVYPSRTENWWWTNMAATALWFVAYAVITAQLPDPNAVVVGLSLAYIAFYTAESLMLTLRRSRRQEPLDDVSGEPAPTS